MKRKIFSKLLMGALLVASVSSFTSCKDYDDDINGLKEDVAKRAMLSDLTALQTTVAGVKSTADQALATANAAATKSELSAAKQEALAEAAKGIANAATAQAAADAAKALAQQAKDAAESIDLSPYAKTTDVDGKISAAAEAAKTSIQAALANYYTAAAIDKMLADLKKEIEDATSDKLDEMKKKVDNAVESVKAIWSGVTNISLYASISDGAGAFFPNDPTGTAGDQFAYYLDYGRVNKEHARHTRVKLNGNFATDAAATTATTQKDGPFGKNDFYGAQGTYTAAASSNVAFKHLDYVRPTQSLIVRVSPANATLTKSDLKFINSRGENLNSVIEIQDVYAYDGLLTRAGSPSGLWVIEFSLADNTMPADLYAKTNTANPSPAFVAPYPMGDIVFAVAANNTSDQAADRDVISEYELTFGATPYDGIYSLDGAVITTITDNWAAAANIGIGKAGEYLYNVKGRMQYLGTRTFNKGYSDYYYTTYTAGNPTANDANGVTKSAIAREGNNAFAVNNGQTFYVHVADMAAAGLGTAQGTETAAKYAYIIRDDKNANISTDDASELNAWVDYQYDGLGTLVERKAGDLCIPITVTIPAKYTTGDEIAFRLFAVNDDGTVVDPDGIPFSVFVGNEVKSATVTGSFHATKALGLVKTFDITGSITTGQAFAATFAAPFSFNVNGVNVNTPVNITFKQADGVTNATNWGNAKKVQVNFSNTAGEEMAMWADNAVGNATLALNSGTPATKDFEIKFALTKELPTAEDVAGLWSWKAEQLKAGVWKSVMYPESAVNATDADAVASWNTLFAQGGGEVQVAYKGINNAINGLVTTAYPAALIDQTNSTAWTNAQVEFISSYVAPKRVTGFGFEFANTYSSNSAYNKVLTVNRGNFGQTADLIVNRAPSWVNAYVIQLNQNRAGKTPIAELIDNTTQHASSIYFNFGYVSSEARSNTALTHPLDIFGGGAVTDYVVKLQDFQTIYSCPFDELVVEVKPFTGGYKNNADKTAVISAGDQVWNYVYYDDPLYANGDIFSSTSTPGNDVMTNVSGATAANLTLVKSQLGADFVTGTLANFTSHLVTTPAADAPTAKLISNSTNNEDYFTATVAPATGVVTLTRISGTSDPMVDVPSTLIISGKCAFGHTHELKIPFTVKTRAVVTP